MTKNRWLVFCNEPLFKASFMHDNTNYHIVARRVTLFPQFLQLQNYSFRCKK
jgi:hypothetical protein